ncbi:hypothetical protein EG867_15890 [Enterococcus faecalis]|nr:hypothetical protein EG867_15890 [Enterococcus faecalis]
MGKEEGTGGRRRNGEAGEGTDGEGGGKGNGETGKGPAEGKREGEARRPALPLPASPSARPRAPGRRERKEERGGKKV